MQSLISNGIKTINNGMTIPLPGQGVCSTRQWRSEEKAQQVKGQDRSLASQIPHECQVDMSICLSPQRAKGGEEEELQKNPRKSQTSQFSEICVQGRYLPSIQRNQRRQTPSFRLQPSHVCTHMHTLIHTCAPTQATGMHTCIYMKHTRRKKVRRNSSPVKLQC